MKKTVALILSLSMLLILAACGTGNGSSSTPTTQASTTAAPTAAAAPAETKAVAATTAAAKTSSTGTTKSASTTTFTNKYGTATTKCAHSGCNNYIASSGDTNCCTLHSNKCLECGKYIDEDAMYCMSCLSKAADKAKTSSSKSSTSTYKSSSSGGSSGDKCHYKENGKEVCSNKCESGSNFCSYHKKYLDDAYKSLFGN